MLFIFPNGGMISVGIQRVLVFFSFGISIERGRPLWNMVCMGLLHRVHNGYKKETSSIELHSDRHQSRTCDLVHGGETRMNGRFTLDL